MEIIKLAGVILITVIFINTLPTFNKYVSALIAISCSVIILLYTTKAIIPAVESIQAIASQVSFNGLDIIFKAIGTGLITQFVADIAEDNDNKALSNQMIFVGRVAILILAMPVFLQVLELIGQLVI